ncbi:hypothetical protein ABIA16_003571 [Sinorhizobium fredii]
MALTSPTELICIDLALGWQSGRNLSFERQPIQEATSNAVRYWHGEADDWTDEEFQDLYEYTISSGDGEMRNPAFSRMQIGQKFNIVLPHEHVDFIATGGTVRTLKRIPHASYLRVVDVEWNDVAFSAAGAVITLAAPAVRPVNIFYRSEDYVILRSWRDGLSEGKGDTSWSLTCADVGGPTP